MIEIQLTLAYLWVGLALAAVVAGVALRLGMLSADGWVAAVVVGGVTYGLGGLPAAILLIAFFASSSFFSKAFASRKRQVSANFAKGGHRDWAQVAANGGVGLLTLIAAAANWIPESVAWVAFAAGLAVVTADTWATEVGVLSARQPILITSGQQVPSGTSGGISLLGSFIALMGAVLIAVLAWLFGMTTLVVIPLIAVAGLLGSFIDSLLGATQQAIYYCPKCKKETERHPLHSCGIPTTLHHGWRWLDNDWVNFLSSLFAALFAAAVFTLLV